MVNFLPKPPECALTYIFTSLIRAVRGGLEGSNREGMGHELYIWLCVDVYVCLGYRGWGGGFDLTQKASRRPGGGWQWLWESSAGERWRGVRQSRDWLVWCVIWGGCGERFKFHSLFTLGRSQWRQLFEGANLEVTPRASLVVEGHMCSREAFPPRPHPPQHMPSESTVQPSHPTHTGLSAVYK